MVGFRLTIAARSGAALVLFLLVAVLTACVDLGGPGLTPTLTANKAAEGEAQPVQVSGGVEFVRFVGSIQTDNECQKIIAKLDRISEGQGILELAVVAETLEGCPVNDETTWNYVGQLIGVAAGTYDVTLRHRFENSSRPTKVVFAEPITVRVR